MLVGQWTTLPMGLCISIRNKFPKCLRTRRPSASRRLCSSVHSSCQLIQTVYKQLKVEFPFPRLFYQSTISWPTLLSTICPGPTWLVNHSHHLSTEHKQGNLSRSTWQVQRQKHSSFLVPCSAPQGLKGAIRTTKARSVKTQPSLNYPDMDLWKFCLQN